MKRPRSSCRQGEHGLRLLSYMAEPRDLTEYQTDHDLLIRVNTIMETMANDIKDMKSHSMQAEFWPEGARVRMHGHDPHGPDRRIEGG